MPRKGVRPPEERIKERGQYTVNCKIEQFVVRPNLIEHDEKVFYEGPAMLVWPKGVFHQIKNSDTEGSSSVFI